MCVTIKIYYWEGTGIHDSVVRKCIVALQKYKQNNAVGIKKCGRKLCLTKIL